MRKSFCSLAILTLFVAALIISGASCAKKRPAPITQPTAAAPPPPPPPVPAPTVTLSASPGTITRGQSSTLNWNANNATSVNIDGGVGTVAASGTRSVSPTSSTTYTATATNSSGSSSASARITVTEPPATPPPTPTLSAAEFFNTRVKDVFFDYDKHDIRPDARVTLEANARAFAERTEIRFTIEGHCDERGSERYNLALGDRRANAAKDFLVSQGVSSGRMETVSYGEERPFAQGQNEAAWSQNRRAHFVRKP